MELCAQDLHFVGHRWHQKLKNTLPEVGVQEKFGAKGSEAFHSHVISCLDFGPGDINASRDFGPIKAAVDGGQRILRISFWGGRILMNDL